MNSEWQKMVIRNVDFCDEISNKVWMLAKDVNLAAGGDYLPKEDKCSAKVFANKAKADFYNLIDQPFRTWLCGLDPDTDDIGDREKEWRAECVRYAEGLGEEIISQVSPTAVFGKVVNDKDKKTTYSAARAYNIFKAALKKSKER